MKNITDPKIDLPIQHYKNHVWHVFVIRTKYRDKLQKYLLDKGIQTLIHYPVPPHKQAAYREWNSLQYPISEKIHAQVLSLPISGIQSQEDTEKIVEVINNWNHK